MFPFADQKGDLGFCILLTLPKIIAKSIFWQFKFAHAYANISMNLH
jgi:hypothetical protein